MGFKGLVSPEARLGDVKGVGQDDARPDVEVPLNTEWLSLAPSVTPS